MFPSFYALSVHLSVCPTFSFCSITWAIIWNIYTWAGTIKGKVRFQLLPPFLIWSYAPSFVKKNLYILAGCGTCPIGTFFHIFLGTTSHCSRWILQYLIYCFIIQVSVMLCNLCNFFSFTEQFLSCIMMRKSSMRWDVVCFFSRPTRLNSWIFI